MASGHVAMPPAARVLPSNVFYGWYITLACAALMLVGVGVGYYGLPIFLRPLSEEHGWSTAQVSWAPAIYFCVSGLTGAIAGPYIDAHGPRGLMFFGMLANAVCAALIGIVDELWQLYLVYFAFAVAFGMSAGVAVNAIITRWFIQKRALAMSVSATGVSLGGVILAPVASKLIDIGGLELATPVLGALVLVVAIPVIVLVLVWDPRNMGLLPDGVGSGSAGEAGAERVLPASQMQTWTRGSAARTVAFWALLAAFVLVLIAQTGYIIHQVSFLEERLGSRSTASFTISLTAFGSIVARLLVGIFADGVDKRLLTCALFLTQALCVAVIAYVDSVPVTWIVTLVFGFTIGNIYMMQSLLVGEIFGMVSFGTVFGLIAFASQVGSGIGPIGVGYLHDWTGGYVAPFSVLAAIDFLAAVAILMARPESVARSAAEPERSPAPA